ncbi:hypothetical protein P775_21085 [Puniceibacterium antarcticum]|uniref:NADP-dependent oxidoreductase domain-containing protein n=1 Tax=Puniceibacterium antarcticum TaxID=1206336 RepID=A0A2G8R9F1_9RHOB|nr:hypothetical protein P775_21085 [Puniceibacterium antarcticum]
MSNQFNLARFASLQGYYSLVGRGLERDLAPMLDSEGLGLMVWSPLAGGFLSGKYRREGKENGIGRRDTFDFPPVDKVQGYDVNDAMAPIAMATSVFNRSSRRATRATRAPS